MINRLISNLPYNPSLVEELSFYSKRLRKEKSIRRLGFVLIILSMLVQIFAASVPAEKSLAESDNDIIRGGAYTKSKVLNAWDNPNTGVAKIYSKFGLTRNDISRIKGNKPNATIRSNGSNFWSIGRNSLNAYSGVQQQFKDKEVAINTGGPTVFLRPLRAWDTSGPSTYDAFVGTNSTTGETFWILADCGNYTQNGPGRLPPPQLEVRKTIVGDRSTVKPGGTIKFRIEYRNKQQDSLAEDVKIVDNLQRDKFNIVTPDNLPIGSDDKLEQSVGNLRYTDQGNIFDIVVRVKNNLKNGVQICNSIRLTSSNAPTVTGGGAPDACIKVLIASGTPKTSKVNISTPVNIVREIKDTNMPPSLGKEVKNITQNLSGQAAIGSDVLPSDIIEYSLITYNSQPKDTPDYEIKDYIGDILDYSDIDLAFLADHGGTYNDKTKEVVWTKQNLISGQDNTKKFRVKIKDPIPSTNKPSKATTSFDCKISNEYGNEITMVVQCPIIKSVESLPNTGPGAAVAITFGLASFSGYFLARNGLLSKELFIIRRNYAISGDK